MRNMHLSHWTKWLAATGLGPQAYIGNQRPQYPKQDIWGTCDLLSLQPLVDSGNPRWALHRTRASGLIVPQNSRQFESLPSPAAPTPSASR